MNSTKTVWKVISLILVLGILAGGVLYLRKTEQADQKRMKELYAQAEPLQREREALSAELESLELNYALMMRDVSTVQILFCELDSTLFSDVYPLMRDRGITGVLGVSDHDLPNMMGKITAEEYKRLLMDHWGSCLVYDDDDPLQYWIAEVEGFLKWREIDLPKAIYFVNNDYTSDYDEFLLEKGITTVISGASDGHSETVTDVNGEFWYTGAMPWNYTGAASDMQLLAVTDGGNLSFTVSFRNLWDAYEKEGFLRVLDTLQEILVTDDPMEEREKEKEKEKEKENGIETDPEEELEKPLLRVLNYESARQKHLEATEQNAVLDNEFRSRQEELEAQIAELDEQIRAIYDKWEKGA